MVPYCVYQNRCGGCLYRDIPRGLYIQKKQNFVKRAFSDFGLSIEPNDLIEITDSSRRRVSFHFEKNKFGFYAFHSHELTDIDCCIMLTPVINSVLPELKRFLFSLNTTGTVYITDMQGDLDIQIEGTKNKLSLENLETAAQLFQKIPCIRILYNKEVLGQQCSFPQLPSDFLQPSVQGQETLVKLVCSFLNDEKKGLDLFCGAGTFLNPLLEKGIAMHGYDSSVSAIKTLNDTATVQDLFRQPVPSDELDTVDFVVLDPPRAGAKAQCKEIAKTTALKKVIMVSCMPKTAARDCKILCDSGFEIKKVIPVDQFAYSNHIELVILLER